MTLRSVVRGVGAYLPKRVVPNAELEASVETTDAWIAERTGIRQRHIAADGELTSHLGAKAAAAALAHAGLAPDDIDLVILATTTPDDTAPATATKIQHQLGMTQGGAFDVNSACAGFIFALATADGLLRAGTARRALVIGAETYSRIIDWRDRNTCVLFGDGAAALVLEAQKASGHALDRGVLFSRLQSDGQYHAILRTTGGISSTGTAGVLQMTGREVFRHAVPKMADPVVAGLDHLGLSVADLDWVVPHQANSRILQAVAKHLNVPEEKLISTVGIHANTSAASIPLALCEGVKKDKIKQGQLLALPALGAGLSWGACILRW